MGSRGGQGHRAAAPAPPGRLLRLHSHEARRVVRTFCDVNVLQVHAVKRLAPVVSERLRCRGVFASHLGWGGRAGRAEGGWHVPEEAYLALETLLPTGMGSFLELWAARDAFRDGWTFVVDPAA